jgi:Protein of unknown function with PCYCGC motif
MSLRRKWLSLAVVASVAVVAAVVFALAPWTSSASRTRSDLENVLDLSTQPAEMVATYHYIEGHPEMAKQIPCYCGCRKAIGHTNLFDCFVISPSVYSDHASGCMVCGNEANDVRRLAGEGQSARDIRTWIDTEYSRYGAPTDTPKVRS